MKKWLAFLLLFAFPCVSYGIVYPSYYSSFSTITTIKWSVKITLPTPQPTSLCGDDYAFDLATKSENLRVLLEDDLETATSMINNINNTMDAYINYMDSYNASINNACNTAGGPMSDAMCNVRKQQAAERANANSQHSYYVNSICSQRANLISFMQDAIKRGAEKMENTINSIKKWLSSADKAANEGNYTKAINDYEEAIPYLKELDGMESIISQIKSTINDLQQLKDAEELVQKTEKEWNKLTEQYNKALEYGKEGDYDRAIKTLENIIKNEGTVEWGDNYKLAKEALNIYKEGKKKLEEGEKYYQETGKVPTDENNSNLPELNQAILRMYEKGLTIFNEPESFMASRGLRRDEAAKFYVQYAKQVMGKTPDYSRQGCNFKDLGEAWSDLKDIIVESCQLGLFQGSNGKFMPTQQLTNAQAITVFMRLLEGYKDETGTHFANNYYESAHNQGFLYDTPLDNRGNFDVYTTRGDVAKMLFRGQKQ